MVSGVIEIVYVEHCAAHVVALNDNRCTKRSAEWYSRNVKQAVGRLLKYKDSP